MPQHGEPRSAEWLEAQLRNLKRELASLLDKRQIMEEELGQARVASGYYRTNLTCGECQRTYRTTAKTNTCPWCEALKRKSYEGTTMEHLARKLLTLARKKDATGADTLDAMRACHWWIYRWTDNNLFLGDMLGPDWKRYFWARKHEADDAYDGDWTAVDHQTGEVVSTHRLADEDDE